MAGPYDYTVNIPQPPAQNFLQSLSGIMQIRNMQDQAAIAQQQADIQKQQAGFAQELQPLEKQRLEATIAAQRAGTSATQTSQQAAAYQLQQRKDLDAELLGMSSDPSKFTAENLQKLAVRFHSVDPTLLTRSGEMRKNMPDQAKIFGDNIAKNLVLTSVTGDSEAAIQQLDEQLKAAKNTPGLQDFVPKIEQLRDNFIKYPDQTVGLAAVGQTLFAPDQGKAITDVLSEQAKTAKTKAEATGEKTKSELQEAQARLARADAELKELKATGKLDAEEIIKQETARRENFISQPFVRDYPVRRDAYNIITTADETPIGDSSKVVAFIKLQDPRSVVSVTEKGQITSTTPIASVQSLIAKFNNDGLLDAKTRRDINSQSKKIFDSTKFDFDQFKKRETVIAKRYGLNPENIVSAFDVEERQPTGPVTGPTGAPGLPISTGNIPVAPNAPAYTPPAGVTIKSRR
jgi:hypothetical protein